MLGHAKGTTAVGKQAYKPAEKRSYQDLGGTVFLEMSDTRASCALLRMTLEGGLGSLTKQNEERKASEKAREWHPEDEGRKQASPWRDIVPKRKDGEAGEDEGRASNSFRFLGAL